MASKRPPLEMDDITTNLKHSSGKGVDAFFSQSPTQPTEKKYEEEVASLSPTPSKEKTTKSSQNKAKSSSDDVMTSSRQDVNNRKWRDIIEDTEVTNSALRLTREERYQVEDLVQELRRKYKIKTSMNEVVRLGLLYIIDDFKKNKSDALIIKVKKS